MYKWFAGFTETPWSIIREHQLNCPAGQVHPKWDLYGKHIFSSSCGDSCATILLLVSCTQVSFLMFLWGCIIFSDLHWKPGFDYMVQQSGLLWVAEDKQSVCSMANDKKSCLCVYLFWGFWHLLAVSLWFIVFASLWISHLRRKKKC